MGGNDFMSPLPSGAGTSSGVDMRRQAAATAESLAPGTASHRWPGRLLGALALSMISGAGAGWICGGATGVREGVAAGARSAVTERGSKGVETARLLEEVRGLRAQIEQFRHAVEAQRAAEQQSAVVAKLQDISTRLERLERAAIDATPVGSVRRPPSADDPRRPGKATAH
jgi:hypothetical protein